MVPSTAAVPQISASGNALTLDAATVTASGVDLLGWNQALQAQVQALQTALVASVNQQQQDRVRLETMIGALTSRVRVLEGTTVQVVAHHNGQ